MTRFILVAMALVALAAITSASALAGKGGHVPKAGGTLVVTPSTIAVGQSVEFSGSGFKPNTQYFVLVFDSAGTEVLKWGSFSDTGNLEPVASSYNWTTAGTYLAEVHELKPSGVLATPASASATFTVTP